MHEMKIDGTKIERDGACYVIAEVGQNHQGDVEKAKQIFKAAKECGANAVKIQKRDNRGLYTKELYNQPYDNENSFGDTYGEHREALEFDRDQFVELQRYCREIGVTFFSTAWDFKSVDFLEDLDMPAYKIASGDLTNTPLLEYVARLGKPMIVSTGGGTMEDVRRAHDVVMPINSQLCLLQCTAGYPVEPEDMNLKVIELLREEFPDVVVGLSDHQSGIAMALVGYVLGARVIEKHFTLHRHWKGTDQSFSLEPVGMRKLVRDLQRAHEAMGSGVKQPLPQEEKPIMKMRKKLVAAHDLPEGHTLTRDDVAFKSPGDGLLAYEFERVLGKTTKCALAEDDTIRFEDLEG